MQMSQVWMERTRRLEQLDECVRREGRAHFGFEELSEADKADRVRRHFDAVARKYDLMNTLLSFGAHYLWKHRGIRLLDLKPGDRVLDVSGGTGDLSVLSHRAVGQAGQVVLYDINRAMITAGRQKRTHAAARRRIVYVQGDAEKIAFQDNIFDAVMIGFAVRNITHMKQAFREMVRVLRPGGVFLCLEFSRPVWHWFRRLYDIYSFSVMPVLGNVIAGNRKAYACLPETIRLFLLPDELSEIFREVGLSSVRYRSLTNGIAVAHTALK
jgi:demethylmenaquinone methyltransferase/2-methoxy-6-polyprenyl-1,4-benzoquinol methylase